MRIIQISSLKPLQRQEGTTLAAMPEQQQGRPRKTVATQAATKNNSGDDLGQQRRKFQRQEHGDSATALGIQYNISKKIAAAAAC